jgi:hypothetical protein
MLGALAIVLLPKMLSMLSGAYTGEAAIPVSRERRGTGRRKRRSLIGDS